MCKRMLPFLAVVLFLLAPATGEAQDARAAIEEVLDRFEAAFKQGDAAGIAALYTEDAALLPPDAPRIDGRQAIADFWQGAMDEGFRDLNLRAVEVDARDDLAYELGEFSVDAPGPTGQPETLEGKYIVVWKQGGDGAWRVHRDIWNMNAPPPPQ